MKKIIFIFLSFIIVQTTVNAQKGINFSKSYEAGGKLIMCIDSSAKNVFYNNIFPNQPNTSFNYLPEVANLSVQIYFRTTDSIQRYRYTILVDDKTIVLNNAINKAELTDIKTAPDELFSFTTIGTFPIQGKVITILVYDSEKPLNVDKSVFYGKAIPKAKIKNFAKHFVTDQGFSSSNTPNPKQETSLIFTEKDNKLTVVKDKSDIDYLYKISIRDQQTDKIVFESTAWEYSGYIENHQYLPYVDVDKSVFKNSGDYEIVIQPFLKWNTPLKEIEKYTARYILSVNLEENFFSTKQLITSGILFSLIAGAITGGLAVYLKNKQIKRKVAAEARQKEFAQLQLNSVRSQLNPHFLFNALAGIQNLMNKNEIDNANRYLTKFARLTRNVLNSEELISLTEEKTLLDDYLQMEQLRFGFQYKISASAGLDTENIEIPAMLLQPFVENAVKHGIAEKGNNGEIAVGFEQESANLILKITDNGNGFDARKTYDGLGLSLSKNRISLLSTIYKDTPFILNIQSDKNGTAITITLTQWI